MAVFENGDESVEVYRDDEHDRIVVAPLGHWTMATAQRAIAEFSRLLGNGTAHFVGDIRVMEGYESSVRKAWQETFFRAGKRILSYTFVGKSTPLVRMGVAAMSLYLRVPFRSVTVLAGLHPARRHAVATESDAPSP
jgi:hypothetical protein